MQNERQFNDPLQVFKVFGPAVHFYAKAKKLQVAKFVDDVLPDCHSTGEHGETS